MVREFTPWRESSRTIGCTSPRMDGDILLSRVRSSMELSAGPGWREGHPWDYLSVSMQTLGHTRGDLHTYRSPAWLTVAEGWVAAP